MKRSSFINLDRMRKHARQFALAPLALAVLSGCSPQAEEKVQFVSSVDDCKTNTQLTDEQCEAAYAKAVKDAESTAPRYQNQTDCLAEFGQCTQGLDGFFMPFMAGYIVSELIDGVGDRKRRDYNSTYPVYTYRGGGSYHNKIMTADGHVLGNPGQRSYRVTPDVLTPKPKATVTKTLDRGGFGSKAAAKSNWGSSNSSKSSSSSSGKSSSGKSGGWGG